MDRPDLTQNHPDVMIIDCDGVLTDGKLNIDPMGEKVFKSFHTRDVRAIRFLVASGIEVYIVSADGWEGGKKFADKVGAVYYELREKSQLLQYLDGRHWWAVGDDAWDVQLLKKAERAFCPADADYSVWNMEPGFNLYNLNRKGGDGVIAELVYLMFRQ